ncbi:hypothetical protein BC937DRAFT_93395 [Endogone sp. FLAS-F59071]|nr:hypothetical protein BC937DRAFT_93395 [Endogone sp. FLAS-F59071]|eukprot:RUS21184.1 hypothetical protein BC937DRAFT_93395 [Endogone sp. FLAS-F59071]
MFGHKGRPAIKSPLRPRAPQKRPEIAKKDRNTATPPPAPTDHAADLTNNAQLRISLLKDLGMDTAVTAEGKSALRPCIRLRAAPPEFRIEADYHSEELTCQSGWTRMLVDNGFTRMAASAVFPMVSTELGAAFTAKRTNVSAEYEKVFYRIEYLSKAHVYLDRDLFEPTDEFEKFVTEALRESTPMGKYLKLKEVWERFGYIMAQKLYIGGKLTMWESFTESQRDSERQALREARGNVSVALNVFGAGASLDVKLDERQNNSAAFSIQRTHGMVLGGEATATAFLQGRKGWEESVNRDIHSWKIIKRDRIVPIYEYLGNDLRDQVRQVMERAINMQHIRPDTTFKIRSCFTKHCLAWQEFYYAQHKGYSGMVVCTSPLHTGPSNENNAWNFIVVDTSSERASSHISNSRSGPGHGFDEKVNFTASPPHNYLRYNDVVYIQPASFPERALNKDVAPQPVNPLYLHGSHNNYSPVTKTAPEVSLRYFLKGKPNQADQWVIERVTDEAWDTGAGDIDVDVAIRRTAYVLKSDNFRLRHRATDVHYLSSHQQTIERIEVRKKPDDMIPRSIGGSNGAGILARHYHEVLLLKNKECGEQKDEWEFFQIDSGKVGG